MEYFQNGIVNPGRLVKIQKGNAVKTAGKIRGKSESFINNCFLFKEDLVPKFAVVSLGCSKNLVDTEIMLGQLVHHGWEMTHLFEEAEMILINTCGFVETAKSESINQILEMAEYKKPGQGSCKKLVIAGCLVQRYAAELSQKIPEVDYWIGLGEIGEIVDHINPQKSEAGHEKPGKDGDRKTITALPFLNEENLPRFQVTLPHTSFVKIAEGCNHCCSYCAIPLIKGNFRSRSLDSIIKEVKTLVQSGVKEINLIAQDITMYGKDLSNGINLKVLVQEILEKANPPWIRLLYAYPLGIDEDLLKLMAETPSICKYLDLPLQHINPRILEMMNRHDSIEQIKRKLDLIRTMAPGVVLRTTFLVGFPTESEAEFEELLDFVNEGHFEHIGVFTYSREEGTKAFKYKPQLPEKIKQKRKETLLAAQQEVSFRFLAGMVNSEQLILIDEIFPEHGENELKAIGRTERFAPDIDGVVYLKEFSGKPGDFTKGLITGNDAYNLWAKEIF